MAVTRRDGLLAALAALPLAGCGREPELPWSLGSVAGLPPGGAGWSASAAFRAKTPDALLLGVVFVRREANGDVRALDARCGCRPPEICPPRWIGLSRRFVCPCHAGIYDEHGRPIIAAERALEPLETRVEDGTIYVAASRR